MIKSKHIKLLSYKLLLLLFVGFLGWQCNAQSVPYGINYQAALRENNGAPIADSAIILTVWLRQASAQGDVIYEETHAITTNALGLFQVAIGQGTSSNHFDLVDWGNGPYFLELLLNGNSFSVSQLLSVPFALHAETASSLTNLKSPTNDHDLTTKLYVDSTIQDAISTRAPLEGTFSDADLDDLLNSVNKIDFSEKGDTLFANGQQFVIPGLNANNNKLDNLQRCLGGSGDEEVKVFFKTEHNTYILGAESTSRNGDLPSNKGQNDIWIAELDSTFRIIWQKVIGGSHFDHLTHLVSLENNELLLAGTTESNSGDFSGNHGSFDIFIGKLDAQHELKEIKCFGGTNADFINSLKVLNNGSILIGGTTFSSDGDVNVNYGDADIWIIKLDPRWEVVWKNSYGSLRFESLQSMEVTDNNELLLFGETESNSGMVKGNHGALDIWICKIDMNGTLLDQLCIGTSNNEEIRTVKKTNQTFTIGGLTFSDDWDPANSIPFKNIWLGSVQDDLSNLKWNNFGGAGTEYLIDLINDENGESVIACTTGSYDGDVVGNNGDQDIWLVSTLSDHSITSQACLGGSYAESIATLKPVSEGYIIAGTSESKDGNLSTNNGETDIWVFKTDENFNITASKHFGGSHRESVFDIIIEGDNFTLVGTTKSNDYGIDGFHGQAGKSSDVWLIKDTFK